MKRIIFAVLTAAIYFFFAASLCGCFDYDTVVDYPKVPALSVAPASCAPSETARAELPTETSEAASAEPTEAPPRYDEDDPFLILVNFENPIYEEPPVVLICDHLTAGNVTCDPRRHANETALTALNEMLLAAEREGKFHFIISSAFRYIWEQQMMWDGKMAEDPDYGSDPYNEPVKLMPPNCSEHTTGLAFDILCESCPHSDLRFATTSEGKWLAENAHRFGFIMRYPEDKQNITGVQYEPWHFRYVGRDAAEYIYAHSLCLEEYLGKCHTGASPAQ